MTDSAPEPPRMSVPEILKALELRTRRFPKRAVQDAVEHREAITPELLRALDDVLASPQAFIDRDDSNLLVFAVFLLAQFREPRAFRPIVALVALPGETVFDLLGDVVTESLDRILGSVWDGDVAALRRLVEDESVNEYVRFAAIDAFIVLATSGQMPREQVVAYYRDLFHGSLARTPSHVWDGLVCAVADLPAPELLEDVRRAYADALAETLFADLPGIERRLLDPGGRRLSECGVITDAAAEMKSWACFEEAPARPKVARPFPQPPPAPRPSPSPTVTRVKVGRNDPCHCGSGKKFKKCCAA